jgi:replicative DNA helicase
MTSQLMQKLKEDAGALDKLLHPEIKLGDIDVHDLSIRTMPSGFGSLDELLFLKENEGELIIVGGRPSMGKSAFMFQLAEQVAHSAPVHVFSLEMSAKSIVRRTIAAKTGQSLTKIQKGQVSDAILNAANKELSSLQYYVDDRSGISVYTLCDAARTAHKRYGTKLIVIDYLQLLRVEKGHSKSTEVGEITSILKELANDLKVPVIVGSQLNRMCETRGAETGDFRPMLADLRDGGSIEQDADIVLFVHRQSRFTGERPGEADILVAKNRNGPTAEIVMRFENTQTRFIDEGGI